MSDRSHPDEGYGPDDLVLEGEARKYHPADAWVGAKARVYETTTLVLAAPAPRQGYVNTARGPEPFADGDFIVTDDPPTHAWPVAREEFERTHQPLPTAKDDE